MKISVCPSLLSQGYVSYSPAGRETLFGGRDISPHLSIDFDKDVNRVVVTDNVGRISVSGVQEKLGAVIENGIIRLSHSDEQSTYILKPAPLDYGLIARRQIPANEHLTMQIASQIYGIKTAANGLCFDIKERSVYITKRFDILPDSNKIPMADFATLCNRNEQTEGAYFKYSGCYEDIGKAIKKYVASWPIELSRFFKLVIFNYIYGNGDAHMKNFSVMQVGEEMLLAPAYDLLNTAIHMQSDDFGLTGGLMSSGWKSDVYKRTGHPCKTDFEKFGLEIGVSRVRVERIINEFMAIPVSAKALISNSFLDKKMQRKYLSIISGRTSRFTRKK